MANTTNGTSTEADEAMLDTQAEAEADDDIIEPDEELSLAGREAATQTAVADSAASDLARRGAPEWVMRNRFFRYIYESYYELRYKVTWPRMEEAWQMTLMVIAVSAFVAVLLGALDLGLSKALTYIVGLGAGHHPVATPTPTPILPGAPNP
jgi:preprotein translocase SecE subunit